MPITLADFTDEELIERGVDPKLRKNFISVATGRDFRITRDESRYLDGLYDWSKQSERTPIALGVPRRY